MKKIKLVPTPQVTLNFSVSDEMISDIKVCRRIAESRNTQRGNDCDFCSWDKCRVGDIAVCGLLSLQDIEQLSAAALPCTAYWLSLAPPAAEPGFRHLRCEKEN